MSQATCALLFSGWSGNGRHPKWDDIANVLSALDTIAQTVEMVGRSAVDDVHAEKLVDVFDSLAQEIQDEVERLKELIGINEPARTGVSL